MKQREFLKKLVAVGVAAMLFAPSFGGVFTVQLSAQTTQDELPENILADKASFDTISSVAEQYDALYPNDATHYITPVNGEAKLQRLNFLNYGAGEALQIDGSYTFDLAPEIAKILRLFGDVRLKGSIADNGVKMYIIDPNGKETEAEILNGHKWFNEGGDGMWTTYTKTDWIASKGSSISTPWLIKDDTGEIIYDGYKVRLEGTGDLEYMYLWEEQGMPVSYDITAYTVIGGDKPVLDIAVDVDTTKNLSINGVNQVEEDVFKRYHMNSGPTGLESASGDVTLLDEVYHKTVEDWGFTPGRGAFHFSLLGETLVEDSTTPGYADFAATKEAYKQSEAAIEKVTNLYPAMGKDYVVTLDGWPKWMWENPESTAMDPHFATPGYKHFDAAADAAAGVIDAIDTRFGGLGPRYVEVKNESTISNEWDFFNTHSKEEAWDYLAEFHNKNAEAIKEQNPDVLVGGPSSAFMYLEEDGFQEGREQLAFMDATKDTLDWYSHHFYENSALFINDKETNPDGFLNGRLEAVLDLINGHMVNTDNIKPILITEEGTYNTGGTEIDYFQKLVAYNGYMLRFMDYADSIDMLVPYIYPIINWKPDATNTFYKYNGTKSGILEEMTPNEAYVDLWAEFEGGYVPTNVNCTSELEGLDEALAEQRVYTKAVRQGDKVYVAVHNLNAHRINLDLNVLLGEDAAIQDVTRKHFYLEKGKLVYEEVPVESLEDIYMRVEEMSMFEITLENASDFEGTLLREVDYATEQIVASGADKTFTIPEVGVTDLEETTLRVGFSKEDAGFAGDMTVQVNGHEEKVRSLAFTDKQGDIYNYLEFAIPTDELVEGDNTVVVSLPEGGYVSTVQFFNHYNEDAPQKVDKARLVAPLAAAKTTLDSVCISADGLNVQPEDQWVTQTIYGTLHIAIDNMESVYNNPVATETQLIEVEQELAQALAIFNTHIQEPVLAGQPMGVLSFETDEAAYKQDNVELTSVEVVEGVGNSEGNQALRYTVNEMCAPNSWGYKQLRFNAPTEDGWALTAEGLQADITNPNDFAIQVRVFIKDITGANATQYFVIEPQTTRTIQINEFAKRADHWGGEGWFGFQKNVNPSNLQSIGFYLWEDSPELTDKGAVSFIIDNVR